MRSQMINEIMQDMEATRQYTGKDHLSANVLAAVSRVQRHLFVPDEYLQEAYANHPLPIGQGQTISQPFIVALMSELLEIPEETDRKFKVLELGTGSGYQAAVLAELVDEVFSIEIVESLANEASARLKALGYLNVDVKFGDGTLGWPDEAPFDGIIVTAAGVEIPDALVNQLRPGARLVMPLGGHDETQQLMVITLQEDGSIEKRTTLPVRFVPITSLPTFH